jgi:hypothetical protein
MAARRILYVTAEDHYLYRAARGALELEAKFAGDDLGVAAFREHLRVRRGGLFSVVADLTGEDFHEDQIPLVRGGDREAIIARRIAGRYRDTRLATALSLGEVVGAERRNERLLLASFTSTQQLAPWLDALEEAGERLAGVYSVPLLAPALAVRLGVRGGRALLVTATRAGLRQCYVDNGRLRFARLERTIDMVPQALAMFVRSESQRLAQYLVTLRALPREGGPPVQVVVVAPPGQREVFEQVLISDTRLVFRTIDLREALDAVKLRRVPEGAAAESLYLHLAATRAPREQFASRQDRRRYFVWQLQRGLAAAGALGFAACALYAGSKWVEAMDLRDTAAAQTREARFAAERYERITASFPVTQTTTENLKVAVVEFQRLAQAAAPPERALAHVSQVLNRFPQMELDTITWSVGKLDERARGAKPPGAPAPPPAAGRAEANGDLAVQIELVGRVNSTQRNDYRGLTAQVESFVAALTMAGYELVERKLPFDVTSEGTLTGDMAMGGGEGGEAPRFTVVIARRLP